MDYLIPSAMEVPRLAIVDHCTPSPLTTFGQKGSGEAGYLGAPAAVANAINDALDPLGAAVDALPMSHLAIWTAISGARGQRFSISVVPAKAGTQRLSTNDTGFPLARE
jgi:2-furoyl-CoA dehydrogenase large subunit